MSSNFNDQVRKVVGPELEALWEAFQDRDQVSVLRPEDRESILSLLQAIKSELASDDALIRRIAYNAGIEEEPVDPEVEEVLNDPTGIAYKRFMQEKGFDGDDYNAWKKWLEALGIAWIGAQAVKGWLKDRILLRGAGALRDWMLYKRQRKLLDEIRNVQSRLYGDSGAIVSKISALGGALEACCAAMSANMEELLNRVPPDLDSRVKFIEDKVSDLEGYARGIDDTVTNTSQVVDRIKGEIDDYEPVIDRIDQTTLDTKTDTGNIKNSVDNTIIPEINTVEQLIEAIQPGATSSSTLELLSLLRATFAELRTVRRYL